ncbi:retrovirus-related pol polyprotein from transposon TNT 1-94 [Tanacetum coccineum]
MSRTMLNEQSLPQKFWCNAVDTSTYILNQILIRAILGKTPYELLKGYSQNNKAYIILNKHSRKGEESLNVTFDETPPPSKTSPLVDDDLDEKEAIKVTEKKNLENDIEDESLEIDKIVYIKESKNHPLENVRIYQKSQEYSQKRASTDTRIRRVQKEAKESKPKPEKSSLTALSRVPALWPWFVQSASAVLSYEGNADLL